MSMTHINASVIFAAIIGAAACGTPAPEDFSDTADHCRRQMHDHGADEVFEAVTVHGYDADGRLEWVRGDMENYGPRDGRTNWIRRYVYDGDDQLVRIEGDHVHTDDQPDELQFWRYDDGSRVIRYAQDGALFTAEGMLNHSFPADGDVDLVQTWEYDDEGRKSRLASDGLGVSAFQPDGEPDEITTWEHDGALITRAELRRDGPTAEPDEVVSYEYDDGRKIRQEHDYKPVDGQPEVFLLWTYDQEGRPVRQERYLTDDERPSADEPVEVIRWTYDSTGRKARETRDGHPQGAEVADGHPDIVVDWRDGCFFDD